MQMRRKEREVTDQEKVDAIIADCDCCRLGLADGNRPYIVPLNFGYERADGKAVFYFHAAREGRKIGLIRRNGCAGFELDTDHRLDTNEKACGHSYGYRSVIGTGRVCIVEDRNEKLHGLKLLMRHYTEKENWAFEERYLEKIAVIRLEVEEMTGKAH